MMKSSSNPAVDKQAMGINSGKNLMEFLFYFVFIIAFSWTTHLFRSRLTCAVFVELRTQPKAKLSMC